MKRFHIHVGVKNIEESIPFYTALFGQKPTKQKPDYAKWMLDDPRINFAISTLSSTKGVDHLGIQVDEASELEEIAARVKQANIGIYDQGETTCCYARSNKAWVQDPAGIPWEAYQTMGDAEVFKAKESESGSQCCPTEDSQTSCCG